MADIQVKITNMPQIRAAFRMAPDLMTRELNLAIRKSIITIGGRSRRNTPVDTGVLRSSTQERFATLRGEVGTHTNYDLFVHEGTKFMKGRPYLRMAVESSEVEVQQFFTESVESVLNDIGRRT